MTTEKGRAKARKNLRELSQLMPPSHPVRIIFADLGKDDIGECYLLDEGKTEARFIIRIGREVNDELITSILVHEFAHVCSWYWEECHHGPAFGIATARAWSLWADGGE